MALKYVPIGGNDQSAVVVDPPTEKELNAVAEVPQKDGSSRSIGKVVPKEDALTKNVVKIDKYHRLRLPHQGFIEKPEDMKTAPSYEKTTVTLDDGTEVEALAYVGPDERNIKEKPYATTDDDHVITNPGTFTVTEGENQFGKWENTKYNGDASSTEGGNGLIQPVPALAADEKQKKALDRHWRRGEDLETPIDPENYLSRPGMPVKTSETYLAQINAEVED